MVDLLHGRLNAPVMLLTQHDLSAIQHDLSAILLDQAAKYFILALLHFHYLRLHKYYLNYSIQSDGVIYCICFSCCIMSITMVSDLAIAKSPLV